MNETLKVIHNRRSIRAYRAEQITDSELQEILDAAVLAPSAVNLQPWHFTVIQNQDLMDRMVKDTATAIKTSGMRISPQMLERVNSPDYHTFYHAPTVIIVSGEEKSVFAQNDCANAAQNILLAAESLNIGSCWIASVLPLFTSEKGAGWKMNWVFLRVIAPFAPLPLVIRPVKARRPRLGRKM